MPSANPNDLGARVYAAISQKSINTEPATFAAALGWFVRAAAGNVSAAARLMGVPRRSLRDWLSGTSRPGAARRAAVTTSARLSARRDRLRAGRESRLRGRDASGVRLVGYYNYDGPPLRTVRIGDYLAPDAIDSLIDAYLSGAGVDELRQEFAGAIVNDPTSFYANTMFNPADDEHGWTVTNLTL